MKSIKLLIKLSILIAIILLVTFCNKQDLITENIPNGLKIPIENNINGSVVSELIDVDITRKNANPKVNSVSSGSLEDQYLVDDFNHDGYADVAVRRGNLLIIDTDRDGVSNFAFTFGNGNLERGYYTTNGGIAVVRGSSIFIDDNFDGLADRSFSYGNGNSEAEYIFLKPTGVAVRRADINSTANHILQDDNMDGYVDRDFYWGNGNSEDQYAHGFTIVSGWCLRRNYIWYTYPSGLPYSFGYGNAEDGYFLGKYDGGLYYDFAVLRGNTLYHDDDRDGTADGNFSFGTGLK